MTCETTQTPPLESIDIPALKEIYRLEKEKRQQGAGSDRFVHLSASDQSQYVKDPHKPLITRDSIDEDLDVLILGGGFSGILAAYHLKQQGVNDIRNVDLAGDFGGVWYWNRYPGVQCDNDAYCYLPLLEEMGYLPSKKFSDGSEIYDYCKSIAERFGFADRALFHTLIESIIWDEAISRWQVRTNRGDVIRARFVVIACGVLNMPKLPGVKGIDQFQGKVFHTARWDYQYTGGSSHSPSLNKLADKRVAIVGTGATAVQAIPHLAKYAKHLYVVQRTPSSVDQRDNPATDQQWAESLQPGWQKARMANFHRAAMEFFQPGEEDLICDIWTEISRNLSKELAEEGWPELTPEAFVARREQVDFQVMERLRSRVESLVENKDTAESLKPYYRFLCKRPLSNNDYYPVFNQDNVSLIDVADSQGLEEITASGFIHQGQEYPVDCIIFASGFEVTSELERRWGIDAISGRDGLSLYDHWRNGPKTLHGTMTHGFPNQFYVGYIQGGINATTTEQFGQQGKHIAYIISQALQRNLASVEPTLEAQQSYVQHFEDIEIDSSDFQRECTPSYFTNEGQIKAPWALFRAYGHGWQAFMDLLQEWRDNDSLEGLLQKQSR